MPYRLLILIGLGIELNLLSLIVTMCKSGPLKKGCRKSCVNGMYRFNAYIWMCVAGIRTKKVKKEIDYSFYLGPDYLNKYKKDIYTSTIVSNHVSWCDTQNIFQYFDCAMTLDLGFKNVPLMGRMSAIIDSLYLPRGSGEEKRKEAIKTISDR